MASIRRTLSPAYHDRTYQNGVFSSPVASQKYSSFPLRKFLSSKRHRFRRSMYRCIIFFIVGFFLGLLLFSHVDNGVNDINSIQINPPHVNVQLDDRDNHSIKHDDFSAVSLSSSRNDIVLEAKKQLIVITPTYNRALQAYFLNRLGQVLKLVRPPLLWIVVEMKTASFETAEILRKTGVMYRHLVCDHNNMTNVKDRGVYQRNVALDHVQRHRLDGIVYFADDDNIYSLPLFESLREISRLGTWPVAMLAQSKNKAILEGPVCNETQVIGWHTNEKSKRLRRFHVDMSGFAFNSTILWDPKRWRRPSSNPIRQLDTVKEGFQETTFIEQVVEDESQMKGVLSGCSTVLNWHLHLDANGLLYPKGWLFQKNLDVILPIQ